jgi:hypothetical protein
MLTLMAILIGSLVLLLVLLLFGHEEVIEQRHARIGVLGLIVVVAVAVLGYQAMAGTGLRQTAALFIGIPALLASAAAFVPTQSAIGIASKAVTIGLLISMMFLGEGMLCILMTAPLFYAVAIGVGYIADTSTRDPRGRTFLALLVIAPMSLEGVTPALSFNRDVTVTATRIVDAPADLIAAAVSATPRFDRPLPRLLEFGFPRPVAVAVHDGTVRIEMRGGETKLNGMEPRVGTLVLAPDGRGDGFAAWRAVSDDSHMRHFLTWQSSRVTWEAIDAGRTRVTFAITYQRDLDPAWYFGPIERFVVQRAADYLITAVATP